jgi:hypothetical protein
MLFFNTAWTNTNTTTQNIDDTQLNVSIADTEKTQSLTDFGAKKIDNTSIILFWEFKSDDNFSHFEIEESTANNDFNKIETVTFKKNTAKYFSKTVKLDGHIKFYRLKMINQNGSFEYSDLLFVDKIDEDAISISAVNSDTETIELKIGNTEEVKIEIYSISGSKIKTIHLKDNLSYEIKLPQVAGKTLMLQISNKENFVTKKIFML